MRFAGVPGRPGLTATVVLAAATGETTMGMLVDSIYAGDWTGEVDDFLGG